MIMVVVIQAALNNSQQCGRLSEEIRTNLRDHQMREEQGFILVYDITNQASVADVKPLYNEILQNKFCTQEFESDIEPTSFVLPLVLVGNKVDLKSERKVTTCEGKELAKRWGFPFYETSAKEGTKVSDVFDDVVGQIVVVNERMRSKEATVDQNRGMMSIILGCLEYIEI